MKVFSDIKARSVFLPGDNVQISVMGLTAGIWNSIKMPIVGVVTGYSRDSKHCVRVKLKGQSRAKAYAWWFWERRKG